MIAYRYVGPGHHVGVPARDLTAEEFGRLPGRLRRIVVKSGLYRPAKAAKEAQPDV